MTILEELIDAALNVCEKSRSSNIQSATHNYSRSAILLSSTGKTYSGCDVHITTTTGGVGNETHGVSAERAAFLAAVADGAAKFDVRFSSFFLILIILYNITIYYILFMCSVHCYMFRYNEIISST